MFDSLEAISARIAAHIAERQGEFAALDTSNARDPEAVLAELEAALLEFLGD